MKYIKINENGIHIVFGITDKNQIKLLHFSKAEFDENDICKFGKECRTTPILLQMVRVRVRLQRLPRLISIIRQISRLSML